jgi:ABC-type nitrate/sulfonate/bicarbonate transport system substrate-binding protein
MTYTPPSRRDFLRFSLGSAVLLGAGGTLVGCGDDSEPAASTRTTAASGSDDGGGAPTPLTSLTSFPLFLTFIVDTTAIAGGFLERNGVDLDLQFGQGAPQALQQLAAGNVPVAGNAPLAIVRANSFEDGDFVAIASTMQETIYRLVSTEDKGIDTLAALEGRTIGFPTLAGNAEQSFDLMLAEAGVDPTSVQRVAVGNDAASMAFVEQGRVDVIFGTLEAATAMRVAGVDAHIAEIPDANPLLGYAFVTRRETVDTHGDVLTRYLRGLHEAAMALLDDDQRADLLPKVRARFELPQLDDPESANPVIDALLSLYTAAGVENLYRNVPERWEEGVARFEEQGAAAPGSDATSFYTNDLVDEALS